MILIKRFKLLAMKKSKKYFYVTVCLSFLFMSTLMAQKEIFGIRYMPTISTIKVQNFQGDNLEGELMSGNGFGGFIGVNLNKHIGLQVEVIYSQLSQKYKDDNLDRRIDINYVNIPLLLSINTNRKRIVNLNGVIGPQWGINVGATLKTTGVPNGNGNSTAILAVKKNDFGITYGLGLDFAITPPKTIRLDIGFRGVMGLMNVNNDTEKIDANSYYILQKATINSYSGYVGLTFLF
jgi:hypothetical protein